MSNHRPHCEFDVEQVAKYVETLVNYDEVERALLVLDNVPAWYRDNPPERLTRLKREILAAQCTAHAYMSSDLDAEVNPSTAVAITMGVMRGRLLFSEVERLNKLGQVPHIVDVGPGEYHFPIAMEQRGLAFTYHDVVMDQKTQKIAHPLLKRVKQPPKAGVPQIFLALEIIEHLPSPQDLAVECLRHCGSFPEYVQISTPRYTFDTGVKDWRKPCGLPHLRAYTPQEIQDEARRIFPVYHWQVYNFQIMSLRGVRHDVMQPAQITDLLA